MADSGFPPIAGARARLLILGSLPGQESLRQRQYYAHRANAFWKIMGHILEAGPDLPYETRARRLVERRIALWDVCAAAERPGSLDTAIVRSTVVANDFRSFLEQHPEITRIGFNGAKACELYRRLVLPGLPRELAAVDRIVLPSTSPAYAALPFEEKLARWQRIVNVGA